jgi:hypothetical protein
MDPLLSDANTMQFRGEVSIHQVKKRAGDGLNETLGDHGT